MKFSSFKELVQRADSIEELSDYLTVDLASTLRGLFVGLEKLALTENFESFQEELTIAAGAEVSIRNLLPTQEIPTQRIFVKGDHRDISDGDTEWSQSYVYLKNNSGAERTFTVVFLK